MTQELPTPEGAGYSRVLHLDFINLTPAAGPEARAELEAAAGRLAAIEGVLDVGVIEADAASDFDVAFWFLLRDFAALEPFGTDPAYSRFLQGTVAPLLRGFAGADVKLDADFEAADGAASCVALIGPEESYDFEVREALQAWADSTGAASIAIGLAVGEKQMYRGAAIAFGRTAVETPVVAPFRATFIRGTSRVLA